MKPFIWSHRFASFYKYFLCLVFSTFIKAAHIKQWVTLLWFSAVEILFADKKKKGSVVHCVGQIVPSNCQWHGSTEVFLSNWLLWQAAGLWIHILFYKCAWQQIPENFSGHDDPEFIQMTVYLLPAESEHHFIILWLLPLHQWSSDFCPKKLTAQSCSSNVLHVIF